MLTRATVIQQIQQLPEQFSIDELMEKMLFIYKLETGLEQSRKDQTVPNEKVKAKYQKWLG
ncbi:MAG: hypothetical protein ACKVT2_07740 [Saprospiraceae bacterium]